MTAFELRPFEPGDEESILSGFNTVFRAVNGEGFVDRGLDMWRWQFLENPAGHRIHVAVTEDGVVAAQYAAVPMRARTPAGETTFCHGVDSFVLPEYRHGLKRPGLFIHVASAALEHWTAAGDGLFWGLPVPIAKRMSIRFLDYVEWRPIDYLCRAASEEPLAVPEGITLRKVSIVGSEVEALGVDLLASKPCMGIRNAAYFNWRYGRHPERRYLGFEALRNGEVGGFVVLAPYCELVPNTCAIADLLVREGDEAMLDALLSKAMEATRAKGRGALMTVLPPHSFEAQRLLERGFVLQSSRDSMYRSIGVRLAQPGLTVQQLDRGWWYTLGDTDLV